MSLRNSKLIMLLMVTSLLLIISACSGDSADSSDDEEMDPILLSEALESSEYWLDITTYETDDHVVVEDSKVNSILIIEDGLVSRYTPKERLMTMKDIIQLSDKAIKSHYNTGMDEDTEDFNYENEPYHLNLRTDSSGNMTEDMALDMDFNPGMSNGDGVLFDTPYDVNIDDEYFEGYIDSSNDRAFIKKVAEDERGLIEFDSPDTDLDYINID